MPPVRKRKFRATNNYGGARTRPADDTVYRRASEIMEATESRPEMVECGVRGSECGDPIVDCGVRSAECGPRL